MSLGKQQNEINQPWNQPCSSRMWKPLAESARDWSCILSGSCWAYGVCWNMGWIVGVRTRCVVLVIYSPAGIITCRNKFSENGGTVKVAWAPLERSGDWMCDVKINMFVPSGTLALGFLLHYFLCFGLLLFWELACYLREHLSFQIAAF